MTMKQFTCFIPLKMNIADSGQLLSRTISELNPTDTGLILPIISTISATEKLNGLTVLVTRVKKHSLNVVSFLSFY